MIIPKFASYVTTNRAIFMRISFVERVRTLNTPPGGRNRVGWDGTDSSGSEPGPYSVVLEHKHARSIVFSSFNRNSSSAVSSLVV